MPFVDSYSGKRLGQQLFLSGTKNFPALGTRQENDAESTWTARSLNSLHSVDASATERARIFAEHPGEIPIENDRVLEYLQPTRCAYSVVLFGCDFYNQRP